MKFIKKFLLIIFCVVLIACCANAEDLKVDDAVSSCHDSAVYFVVKLEDLSGLVGWALSDENLELLADALSMTSEDVNMIKAIASDVDVKSLMAVIGYDIHGKSFVKAALEFNNNKNILDKIANLEAEPEDLQKLFISNNSPLNNLADGIIKVEPDGNLLRVNNNIWMSARENLLIAGSAPEIVKSGIASINNKSFRLNLKLKYNSKNFMFAHINTESILRHINRRGRIRRMFNAASLRLVKNIFVKALNFEIDFNLEPENFKIRAFINLKDALSENFYNELCVNEPVTGGNLDLNIIETPFIAFGSSINLNFLRDVREFKNLLSRNNISEELFFDLANGKIAFNFGGNFVSMGLFKLPVLYLAKTCVDAQALNDLMSLIKANININEVKSKGWDLLFKAPVTVSPVPLYLGSVKDKLYFGVFEPDFINKDLSKNFDEEFNNLINKKSLMACYINFEKLRAYLSRELNGALRFILSFAMRGRAGAKNELDKIKNFLDAELSIPLVTASELNHGEIEINFSLKKINFKNGIWGKIFYK
ncbi:MAG: hypothetical protein IJP88_10470 [Synergistaceae bacterium]|nr:hypothetical protein [Synergistaceae bacterium]